MNYPGKFDVELPVDAKLPGDGLGAHSHGRDITSSPHAPSDADPILLFSENLRSGVGLIASKDDHEPVAQDYLRSEKRAAQFSPDGAHLTGMVNARTGHVEYAQARGAPDAIKVIGHIRAAIGSGTLTRACGIAVPAKVGDPVCQGDVIETAADGRVGICFIDGTGFELSGGARMVLDEFVCDANGTSHSSLIGVTRGTFAFVVGQVAETGCLRIDTPVGSIRGRARTGGIGMLSLTALIFTVMKEVEAAEFSSQRPLLDSLDDDNINPKDLKLNGTVELFMKDGRHFTLDDPSQTVVISGTGSVSVVTNSAAQMAELQKFQQAALAAYAQNTDATPNSRGGSGSSTPPPFLLSPQGLQPINFDQPVPQNLQSTTTQSMFVSPAILLEAPAPPKPPVLTLAVVTPMVGSSSVNTAHTLNASGASSGFAINGTTDGVENGQSVTVTIVNGSGVTVDTFTSTVANNAWSVNVSPTNARALSDGNYTVTAVVSNAAGTGLARASQNVTVDQTPPATPGAALTTDSGSSSSDHITNVGTLSLSGIEIGATIEFSTNGGTTWTTSFTPVEGLNTVLIRQTDAAGNASGTSALSFILGTSPPAVTFDTVSFTDTGVQGDHITDNGQVTLSGTVSDNVTVSQVQVFNGSQLLGTATVDNVHHTWALTTTLAPGAYNQLNATAIDEAGNPGNATTTQTVQVNGAPVITSGAAATRVSEEGLTNGVPDSLPAGLDTTNSTSASGTITATDVDGDALTMSLGTPSASLTSGGVAIAWTLQDAGHTLIGTAGTATIITATITNAGIYNVVVSGPIDHATANQEDNTAFTVPVIVSDGHTTTPTTLSVTIEDDSPKAVPVEVSIVPTDSKTNVMLVIDLSGSMSTSSGLTGLTRLDMAKAAINELLDQYDNRGDVMVRIVTFSTTGAAVASAWQSVADAKAAIAGLSASGNTNYDAALLTAMAAFADANKLTGPGTQNVSYFVSDGDPTASSDWPQIPGTQLTNGIQADEQAVWESFLTTNKIVSFGLGIPNVGTPANLDPIAFDPASGAQPADTPIIVTDLSKLTNALVFTIPPVTGGVLAGAVGAPPNSFGADGGFVRSITVDGVTYTFNPAANGGAGGITTSGGGSFTYDGTTKTLTVDTDTNVVGGELTMVMTTGAFTFQPPTGFSSKSVGFVLVDGDGDTASSTIGFSAAFGPDHAPIVRDDHVITNISGGSTTNIVIPDYALLYNDSDADGQTIAISGAIANVLGALSVTHASGNVTFTDNNTNGGSFTYAGSTTSPGASDTGNVTIDRGQSGTTLTGSGFGEVLIGRDGINNTINANGGNDVLIGGTGNDSLTGGTGADMMTGAGGVDTFIINSAQSPGTVGGSGDAGTISGYDVITDFATATDILNLQGTAAAATGTNINGTDSSLTVNSQTIKSHSISNGMITFDDANSFGSLLTLSSTADVAAAVDYLHRNDLGNASATVAFVANIGGTAHTYVFEQVGTAPNAASDILVDFAGVTLSNLTALIPSRILPAGVSGSPMNLGLTDPADHVGSVTVAIAGVPSGWTLSEGTNNGDGSWTIQASSVPMLSIASPGNYTGAMALEVTMGWTHTDGSSGFARATDNVEVFAQGAPVFAWSGDDHLTGSSGKDLFVFAQPIGHDTIYGFDVDHDQLDLIGYSGFTSFADIEAHMAEDANGDAVITLGDGQLIELQGVHAVALTENNVVFNQSPTVDNAATITISDGALLPLSGTIVNAGTIALNSIGDETNLQLIKAGVTLEGGGRILLSDSDANIISGTSSGVTLNNEDNTISGAGQLGNGELTLINAGTIDATGSHALTIDTGSNLVTNSGILEASGSGGMMIASGIVNSGVLWANGATLTVQGAVSGSGTATIDGLGTLDFEASASVDVVFGSGTGGALKLGDSFHFNGTISGFGGADVIDLANVAAANASISYHENGAGTGGMLAISDGTQTLELSLLGHYSADDFRIVPDQLHGTSITYVPHDLML